MGAQITVCIAVGLVLGEITYGATGSLAVALVVAAATAGLLLVCAWLMDQQYIRKNDSRRKP